MDFKDYDAIGNEILKQIGGKENVINLTHCITRLRFTLKDRSIVNKEAIESIPLVMSIIEKSGQFQIVIGNKVTKVYDKIYPYLDLDKVTKSEKKLGIFDRVTAFISGVFIPILGFLTAEGVLKGILACLTAANILSVTDQTYFVLNGIGDVLYYFFPIFLGASTAKYLKMNMYVGMGIGGAMIYPTFVAAATDGSISSFLGIPMTISNYTSTVFPVIFAVIVAFWLEKVLNKIVPDILKYFLNPLLILLIVVPISLWIIGPSINFISGILVDIIVNIYSFSPILAGLLIGGPWIVFVMFGLHWAFIPIFIMNMASNGSEPIVGLFAANQLAMAGAALGMALVLKNKEKKAMCMTNSVSCFLGVSEPSIYGVLLPYKKPFIISIIIGSLGGALAGFFGVNVYSMGAAGLLAIPSLVNPNGIDAPFIWGMIIMALSAVLGVVVTYIVMKKDISIIQENSQES